MEKAKDYYELVKNEQLGPNHVDVADSYNNLASVCNNTDDLEKAKHCYERALEIRKEQLGPNHGDVAVVLHCPWSHLL
jgi:tetratricopeptide (TPR) repeat protein